VPLLLSRIVGASHPPHDRFSSRSSGFVALEGADGRTRTFFSTTTFVQPDSFALDGPALSHGLFPPKFSRFSEYASPLSLSETSLSGHYFPFTLSRRSSVAAPHTFSTPCPKMTPFLTLKRGFPPLLRAVRSKISHSDWIFPLDVRATCTLPVKTPRPVDTPPFLISFAVPQFLSGLWAFRPRLSPSVDRDSAGGAFLLFFL